MIWILQSDWLIRLKKMVVILDNLGWYCEVTSIFIRQRLNFVVKIKLYGIFEILSITWFCRVISYSLLKNFKYSLNKLSFHKYSQMHFLITRLGRQSRVPVPYPTKLVWHFIWPFICTLKNRAKEKNIDFLLDMLTNTLIVTILCW